MKPPCHNRPRTAKLVAVNNGRNAYGGLMTKLIPNPFEDRCTLYDGRGIGPNGESYPVAHGWNCAGCKWLPLSVTLVSVSNEATPDE